MSKEADIVRLLSAHIAEGRRLAEETDLDVYDWQYRIGSWYIAGQQLVSEALPEAHTDYMTAVSFGPVAVEDRLHHALAWFEAALAARSPTSTWGPEPASSPSPGARSDAPDFPDIQSMFEAYGFTMPPLPVSLTGALTRRDRFVFSSREVFASPYDFHWYADEAMQPKVDDYVLVARSGHGVNSYALSYYLAWSGVRVLLQLRWGGVYEDVQAAHANICEAFEGLQVLWPSLTARVPVSPSIVVASSDFYGGFCGRAGEDNVRSRWGRVAPGYALECLRQQLELS